jgi:hypothetical protein
MSRRDAARSAVAIDPGYAIEPGVPMPASGSRGRRSKYPFTRMRVGDSFLVRDTVSMIRIRTAASWAGTRHHMKFSCLKVEGGMRVWRTK